jgi:hypothetical protein
LDIVGAFLRCDATEQSANALPGCFDSSLSGLSEQPKNITFPTYAKLLHAAIKGLNRLANKHGVQLRQSYVSVAKRAAMMAGVAETVQVRIRSFPFAFSPSY